MINDTAVLRLRKNNDLYRHMGGTNYRNIRTGVDWKIENERASEMFVVDYNACMLFNKYPQLEELVFGLKLSISRENEN